MANPLSKDKGSSNPAKSAYSNPIIIHIIRQIEHSKTCAQQSYSIQGRSIFWYVNKNKQYDASYSIHYTQGKMTGFIKHIKEGWMIL
jgi:hypothetical protein